MLDRLAAVSSGSIKGRNLPRWVRGGLAVLLLVWLAWALADTAWLLISGPSRLVPPDDSLVRLERAGGGADRAAPALTASRIEQWELFGPTEENVPVSVANAPETRLRLELLGVFQHPSDELASAIIAEKGKDSELYHVGDRLPGNATLEQVLADRVILLRAGQRETLRMKEPELAGEVTLAQEPPVTPSRAEPPPGPPLAEHPQRALMNQRGRILDQLGLQPRDEGGYVVGAGAPAQMLETAGLRPGDIVVSVNGYELGTEENDLAALQAYQETGTATIVVQRDDQTFTISYPP